MNHLRIDPVKRKFFFVLLVCIFISGSTCNAQGEWREGFVIRQQGDSLFGQLMLGTNNSNSKKCEFRTSPGDTMHVWYPGEIEGYRFSNDKYYISREIQVDGIPRIVFLEFLLDGIVDLYYYKTQDKEYFYIEKNGKLHPLTNEKRVVVKDTLTNGYLRISKRYQVETRKYTGMLTYLFQDAKLLQPDIMRTRFEYKSLIRLTQKYHQTVCTDYECISYARSTRIRLSVEPALFFQNTQMKHSEDPGIINDLNPGAGIALRFKPVKIFHHWNFLMGLNWSQNAFSGQMAREETTDILRYKTLHLNHQTVSLPLTVEYSFLSGKVQPFIQAGVAGYLLVNPEHTIDLYFNEHINEYEFINTSRPDNNAWVFRPVHIGYGGGAGIRYCPGKKWYIQGKMEYNRRSSMLNLHEYYDNFRFLTWGLNLTLGYNIN